MDVRKDIKKGDWDFEMIRDFWSIYKEFYIPEDTAKYWTKIHNACVDFVKKYNCKFATELCVSMYCELERRYKQMFKGR